eukprot:PhF_6_TR6747/c0_g1_i1/m.9749
MSGKPHEPTLQPTWRSYVPVLNKFEAVRIQASQYPYVEESANVEDFFLRGSSCHPRLSEFPQCKEVIRDYFNCRDENKIYQAMNLCNPLKEQVCACVNMIFVKNQKRSSAKAPKMRMEKMNEYEAYKQRSLDDKANSVHQLKTKFLD